MSFFTCFGKDESDAKLTSIVCAEESKSTNTPTSITFSVDKVKPAPVQEGRLVSSGSVIKRFVSKADKLEACGIDPSDPRKWVEGSGHAFFIAAMFAFDRHYPFTISPDHIFQLILEGWSSHVEKHEAELRSAFVSHSGKKVLHIQADSFVKGSPNNPWPSIFDNFSLQIKENTEPGLYETVSGGKFTTTDAVASIARNVALMSLAKHYFEYRMTTDCGFPSITLLGTLEDWLALKQKVNSMRPFMTAEFANAWIPTLQSVLDKFVDAYQGKVDTLFWGSMVKYTSTHGSGADTYISGWINALFPYFSKRQNDFCMPWEQLRAKIEKVGGARKLPRGPSVSSFGRFYCAAPMIWKYLGTEYPMLFKTGFIGATQDGKGTVTPQLSWAVLEELPQKNKKPAYDDDD